MKQHGLPITPTHPLLKDDWLTLASFGVIAFACADVSHEALGHGLATLAIGGKPLLLTTCNFVSQGHYTRWIAAGGLMNLAVGSASLAAVRLIRGLTPLLRYWLVLVAAFNLFFAFGYPAYSGIARFGDWAAVISGLQPPWLWRSLLVVIAVLGYYGTMKLLAGPLAPFAASLTLPALDKARLARLTTIPYLAAILLACLAGARNPGGWLTMLTAGFPAAAAAFGLTQMDHLIHLPSNQVPAENISFLQRSYPWIIAGTLTAIFFIGVLGPGIRFSR